MVISANRYMWIIEKLGRIEYLKALEYQNYLVGLKQQGLEDNFFLLLEHDDVFTMGKGADKNNILDKKIPVLTTNRGGDLTYHGPGQLVGYVVMDLKTSKYDLHRYIRELEFLIIDVLKDIDISGYRIEGLTGVWVEGKKIASIGIGVKRGITMHGFALNVNPNMSKFTKINPCGLKSDQISSIKELKNSYISFEHIEKLIEEKFRENFIEGGLWHRTR